MPVKLLISNDELDQILDDTHDYYQLVEDTICNVVGFVETHQLIFQDDNNNYYSVYYENVPDLVYQWISEPVKVIRKSITTEHWIIV